MTLEEVANVLRKHGYIVIRPAMKVIPEPQIGQVWVSPNARTAARTVTGFGVSERFGPVVYFQCDGHLTGHVTTQAWRAWVRSAKAWPQ